MAAGNMTISEITSVMMNAKMQGGIIQSQTNAMGNFQNFLGQNLDSQSGNEITKNTSGSSLQDVVDKNTSNKTKDIIKKVSSSENHTDNKVCEDVKNGIKDIIKEELGISDEELEMAMAELGLTYADLLVPKNVAVLLAEIKDIEPAMIITDAELTNNLSELVNKITQFVNDVAQTIEMPVEQLTKEFETYIDRESSDKGTDAGKNDDVQTVKTIIDESTGKQITITLEDNRVKETSTETVKVDGTVNAEISTTKDITADNNSSKGKSSENGEQAFASNLLNNLTENLTNSIDTTSVFSENYGVNTADVINQLIDSIRLNVNVDTTTMELQLTPENLGKINLSGASKDGSITATITAQNEAVKSIIESQIVQLKETLNNQGLKVTDVEVTIAGQAFDRNAENDNGKEPQRQRSNRRFRGIDEISGDSVEANDETILEQMMEADGNSLNLKA